MPCAKQVGGCRGTKWKTKYEDSSKNNGKCYAESSFASEHGIKGIYISLKRNMDIPGRVLLDTNIVNFILDWGEAIHDGGEIPAHVSNRDAEDILALRNIWLTGQRASWQLAISPRTYFEIDATTDPVRRAALASWFGELWLYWREFFVQYEFSDYDADSLARRLVPSKILGALPESSDRELLAHAIAYECDAMCTRDRKTIIRHRDKLTQVRVRILTPTEWWAAISDYAGLWV